MKNPIVKIEIIDPENKKLIDSVVFPLHVKGIFFRNYPPGSELLVDDDGIWGWTFEPHALIDDFRPTFKLSKK